MKTLITMMMLAMFGLVMVGCEASGSVGSDDNGKKHEVEEKKTVTDANGNVIQSTDTKSEQHTNP
jgi:hypothetical protein